MRDGRVPLGWRIAGATELLLAVVTLIVSVSGTDTRAIPGVGIVIGLVFAAFAGGSSSAVCGRIGQTRGMIDSDFGARHVAKVDGRREKSDDRQAHVSKDGSDPLDRAPALDRGRDDAVDRRDRFGDRPRHINWTG